MKLYEVPRNTKIRVIDSEVLVPPGAPGISKDDIIDFLRVDGMYSHCRNTNGDPVHLAAWTEVEVVND